MRTLTLIKRTHPACPACNAIQMMLDGEGIEYNVTDITGDPTAVSRLDLSGIPVLTIHDEAGDEIERFTGVTPIEKIKAALEEAE